MKNLEPGWQFKNLTIDSKVFYTSMVFILFWFMIIVLNGCSSGIYKLSRPVITHVLAVTDMGDTLKIPINQIRPNIIYNVLGYDYYRPYHYGQVYRPGFAMTPITDYYPYNYNNINSSGNTFGISTIKPTKQITVPSNNNNSGTSGFTGKSVATNPVTSGGKTKKKN